MSISGHKKYAMGTRSGRIGNKMTDELKTAVFQDPSLPTGVSIRPYDHPDGCTCGVPEDTELQVVLGGSMTLSDLFGLCTALAAQLQQSTVPDPETGELVGFPAG
jgi:hypothetical protein